MGFKWVWRLDDDTIADSNVLQTLYLHANENENVGAVGGSVLTPPSMGEVSATGKIEDIYSEPNLQWGRIKQKKEVDHLHCSFLYRAGVADYCLSLSRIAHREETLFTYELIKKGYKNYVVPEAITWHLKNKVGGIRDGVHEMFEHDERIFQNIMNFKDQTIVILDCGMGDHIVFKKVLPYIKNPVLFTCYPEIIPGRSIAEAQALFGDIHDYNVYAHMDRWNWTGSLEDAFKKFYNVI
jgi:GT2 family glycosyltransferase